MIRRAVLILVLIFSSFFMCGCDAGNAPKKPYLLFNSQPINQKTVYSAQKVFAPSQTINYVLIMPKGFKKDYLRMQIVKREDKVAQGGISIYMAKDLTVDASKKFYIDKFSIGTTGTYVVRFFYGSDLSKPFIENILWVKE